LVEGVVDADLADVFQDLVVVLVFDEDERD
jgi:hypothetical protein